MRAFLVLALASAALLGGCVSDQTYIRTDGQRIASTPILEQQYQTDSAICDAEVDKVRPAPGTGPTDSLARAVFAAQVNEQLGKIEQTCMSQKGYTLVYRNVEEVRLAELAVAEEKRKRDAAVAAPPPKTAAAKPRRTPAPGAAAGGAQAR